MKKFLFSVCAVAIVSGSVLAFETVATVNDKNITIEDVNAFLRAIPGARDYASLPKELKDKVINQLIDNQLLLEEAIREGVLNTEEYKEELKRIEKGLALEIWMKKQFDKISVSDEEAKKYYDANGEKFNQPELFNARHIVVKTEAEAKKILAELKSVPKDKLEEAFAAAARKYSTDGTKQNGGELGWFTEDRMVKEFSSAVKGMKKGEMSKAPVKTQFGYHLIYLVNFKPAGKIPFEEVKEQIKQQIIRPEKYREAMISRAKSLREKAKIEVKK